MVQKPPKKGKKPKVHKRFAPDLWPFLYILANHFATMDLSRLADSNSCLDAATMTQVFQVFSFRSARVSVSSMMNQTTILLRAVKFLDERKAIFDEGRRVWCPGHCFSVGNLMIYQLKWTCRAVLVEALQMFSKRVLCPADVTVVGPGVGDEDGAFYNADWQRWIASN